jgi:hypothetical protein
MATCKRGHFTVDRRAAPGASRPDRRFARPATPELAPSRHASVQNKPNRRSRPDPAFSPERSVSGVERGSRTDRRRLWPKNAHRAGEQTQSPSLHCRRAKNAKQTQFAETQNPPKTTPIRTLQHRWRIRRPRKQTQSDPIRSPSAACRQATEAGQRKRGREHCSQPLEFLLLTRNRRRRRVRRRYTSPQRPVDRSRRRR